MSRRLSTCFADPIPIEAPTSTSGCTITIPNVNSKTGGLFLDKNITNILPNYILDNNARRHCSGGRKHGSGVFRRKNWGFGGGFLSVSLSVKGSGECVGSSSSKEVMAAAETVAVGGDGGGGVVVEKKVSVRLRRRPAAAMNTTKHLWAGAVAATVSSIQDAELTTSDGKTLVLHFSCQPSSTFPNRSFNW